MPADRFIHPKLGHSDKVSKLTDFEYRVWTQYLLSADDFGVMRQSAVSLQADNDALHGKPTKTVQRAFDKVVTIGLLRTFQHQGRTYVYQHDWQDFQKVDYPRPTIEPKPSDEALAGCSEETQKLFTKHPGGQGRKKGNGSAAVPQAFADGSATVRGTVDEPTPTTRARARETATATAQAQAGSSGKGSGENPRSSAVGPLVGFPRLRVFRWMVDRMLDSLGDHAAGFGLDDWLDGLESDRKLVIPIDDRARWEWLQKALAYEVERRGMNGSSTDSRNARVAELVKQREARS